MDHTDILFISKYFILVNIIRKRRVVNSKFWYFSSYLLHVGIMTEK